MIHRKQRISIIKLYLTTMPKQKLMHGRTKKKRQTTVCPYNNSKIIYTRIKNNSNEGNHGKYKP